MKIKLSENELSLASAVAKRRNDSQRAAGRKDGLVLGSSIGRDQEGAEAELAVSLALNLPWDGQWLPIRQWDTWKHEGHDVEQVEVRSTSRSTGRLILHHSDKDFSPYILVRSHDRPEFELIGWCFGQEGKQKQFWCKHVPRPCYMVSETNLRPLDELKELLK